jgi:hypothetical protein
MTKSLLLNLIALATSMAALVLNGSPGALQTSSAPSTVACTSASIYDGTSCNSVSTCAAQYWITMIDPTMTEAPISLDPDLDIGTNTIAIMVQHPAVQGRIVSSIVLNGTNAACNYPGVNWRKGVQTNWATDGANQVCRDTYLSAVPWTELCGLVRGENSTHIWFGGNATVAYSDALGTIDGIALGTRQLSSTQQFLILQPKMIRDITTQVRVLDEPRLLIAVSNQQFNYLQGTATLVLTVSLAAPLRTSAVTMITSPAGIATTQTGGIDNTLCGDGIDAVCHQKYTYTIDPQAVCNFDGAYQFVHTVVCHPSVAGTPDCPLAATQDPLSISVNLDSENICEVIENLIGVSGTITSHGEFNPTTFVFGATKTAFFQDQTLHFKVTADSTNDFPFASSEVVLVTVEKNNGGVETIFTKAGGATTGWSFTTTPSTANSVPTATTHIHHLKFAPAGGVFGDVLRNVPADSDVVVSLDVTFLNPLGMVRKRSIVKRIAADSIITQRSAEANTLVRILAVDEITSTNTEVDTDTVVLTTNNNAGSKTTATIFSVAMMLIVMSM